VPRFYFHLYNDVTALDDDGAELPDLAAARAYAIHNARFTLSETIKETGRLDPAHRIEIADEQGRVLATVRYSDAVQIKGCAAPGPHALDQT
jgi:hypothetical protein